MHHPSSPQEIQKSKRDLHQSLWRIHQCRNSYIDAPLLIRSNTLNYLYLIDHRLLFENTKRNAILWTNTQKDETTWHEYSSRNQTWWGHLTHILMSVLYRCKQPSGNFKQQCRLCLQQLVIKHSASGRLYTCARNKSSWTRNFTTPAHRRDNSVDSYPATKSHPPTRTSGIDKVLKPRARKKQTWRLRRTKRIETDGGDAWR